MKKTAIFLFILTAVILSGIKAPGTPETPGEIKDAIIGSWIHREFYYDFQDSVLTAVKIEGEPRGYKTFRYTMENMGGHVFIRYGKDLIDSSDNDFLYVDNVTDSTAVLAIATPFVRADSSKSFTGTWKHVKNLNAVVMTIGTGTIDYFELYLEETTGQTQTAVELHGQYRPGKGKYTGRFYINFDDGTKTILFPVIFGDLMYLFDLSPRKSMFLRTDKAPTFREYQKAAGE